MRRLFWPLVAALAFGAVSAQADTSERMAADCVAETRAPGNYVLATGRVLRVTPGDGGTERGARHVNDCLLDRQSVQFGGVPQGDATGPVALTNEESCRRIRNRRVLYAVAGATGFALGVGDSLRQAAILGGVVGTGVVVNRESRRYRDCVDFEGGTAAGARQYSACSQKDAMWGGSGYCVRSNR